MNRPEFYRPVRIDHLTDAEIELRASPAECAALATRLLLPAIAAVSCRWRCAALAAGEFAAKGVLRAEITQICVASLDPFEATIEEHFEVRFVPEEQIGEEDASEEIDEIPYQGLQIDLGEATAEQLALSLDPFPRREGAVLHPSATDDAANPFAVLDRGLRKSN